MKLLAHQFQCKSFTSTRYFASTLPFDNEIDTFPFVSNNSFMKVRSNPDALFTIAGIPYDGATTNRPGARFGPKAIRDASHMLCDGIHSHFCTSPINSMNDVGDLIFPQTNILEMRKILESKAAMLLKQSKHNIWLGGDHSVTLSLLRAYRVHFKQPLAVIHFDAHCDTWDNHFGEPSGHGTWVYEAVQEGLVIPQCFTQIGIRSSGEKRIREYINNQGGMIYTGRYLRGLETLSQLDPMLNAIVARHKEYGNPPVYLTLDIDCLDPSFAPGTGTPEIGGMTTTQVSIMYQCLVSAFH